MKLACLWPSFRMGWAGVDSAAVDAERQELIWRTLGVVQCDGVVGERRTGLRQDVDGLESEGEMWKGRKEEAGGEESGREE